MLFRSRAFDQRLGFAEAVKEGINKAEAEKIKKQIEEAGGTVELK